MRPDTNLKVPLRVDFAGGWFDVPKLARPGALIVNCAISPGISLSDNWPEPGSGLGGSAAWAILNRRDPVREELGAGVGWQDPAVIIETGLCVWRSGPMPVLEAKYNCEWLRGRMAISDHNGSHCTADLVNKDRDYDMIRRAGAMAAGAVRNRNIGSLARAIAETHWSQSKEGMAELPNRGEWAKRYCGSGHGGYVLRLFGCQSDRDAFLVNDPSAIGIEPYDRWDGEL